ncbi:MAG: PEGA domain-containing protein [Gammaproteobacteria bacterium]|nr:PEGA domain-containing protein [Gammaproteobacteria bacterium]
MTAANNRVLTTSVGGQERHFSAAELPVTIGGDINSDVRLQGVSGSLQIGWLDGSFFIQPGRDTRNLRIDGEPVAGTRWIKNGETIALDTARLDCSLGGERLNLKISGVVTGGDTAPPDLEELAREAANLDEIEIAPVAFRPLGEKKSGALRVKPSRSALVVGGAFVVLAVLGWFAFTAKSVELIVEPEPDTVGLPGTLLKIRMGDRLLLSAGSHRVVAELAGYYPLDTEINVTSAPDQTIEIEMIRLPGLVTLTTEPDVRAEVRVDGERLGITPLTDAEIATGRHQIEFVAERFLAEVHELDVIGGGEHQRLVAELTPNWAPITVTSAPPGAAVLVDGTVTGATPLVMELSAGERLIEVRLRGYNAWADVVSVLADQPQTLPQVELTQADGRVELASEPAGAAVSVDGEYRGQTPLTLRLTPERPHRLVLTKPGYDSIEQELSVVADSDRRLTLPMTARMGIVEVRSDPDAAEVWVDGEQLGVTPRELILSALSHRIEIRLAGFAEQTREVTPRPGFPQLIEVTLEELNTSTGSGYEKEVQTSLAQVLTLIPSGDFMMGSSRREQGRRSNEVLRAVSISEAFYLGVQEVSNAEFRAFRADHDSGSYGGVSLNEDDQPVVRVTWDEIAEFLNWLSIRDGFQPVYEQVDGAQVPVRPLRSGYRLPTEAEWAWAARFAGQDESLTFPWGNTLPPPDRSGNFADVAAATLLRTTLVTYNDSFDVSAPARNFPPNAVGVYDLGGNVAEWVLDYWEIGSPQTETVAVDPLGPEQGRFHVIRGSSWRSATITDLRLAYRNYSSDSREDIGFRIARNLE